MDLWNQSTTPVNLAAQSLKTPDIRTIPGSSIPQKGEN